LKSNLRSHLVPEHLEEEDIVDIKFVEKAFGTGCDIMSVGGNYMRRKQKRFNVTVDEVFHVEGEAAAKEDINEDAKSCVAIMFSEKWMQADHLALQMLRTLPRHCQSDASKELVIAGGSGIMRLAEIMTMHDDNVNIQDGAISVFNKVLDEKSVGFLSSTGLRKMKKAAKGMKAAAKVMAGVRSGAGAGRGSGAHSSVPGMGEDHVGSESGFGVGSGGAEGKYLIETGEENTTPGEPGLYDHADPNSPPMSPESPGSLGSPGTDDGMGPPSPLSPGEGLMNLMGGGGGKLQGAMKEVAAKNKMTKAFEETHIDATHDKPGDDTPQTSASRCKAAKKKLETAGPVVAIKNILIAMRKYKGAVNMQINGCQLLFRLGQDEEAMATLPQRYRDAAVSVCATVLKVHGEKVDHIEEACNGISAMYNAKVAESVDTSIVLNRVLDAMDVDPLRAIMQKSIAIAMRKLCLETSAVCELWVQLDGIGKSLNTIERHPALVGYHIAIWDVFVVIMKSPETRMLIIEAGCFKQILMSMRYHYAHMKLTRVASRLCRIAADLLPRAWPYVDWKEFTELVICAVHLHAESAETVSNCMACLCQVNLQTEDYARIQFDGGAVQHCCKALNMHLESEQVQMWGHRMLWTMSDLFDEFAEPYFSADGPKPLLHAMELWKNDVPMLEPATGVLRNILAYEQFPMDAKFSCLKVLLSNLMYALEQKNDDYVAETCGVLSVLTSVEGNEDSIETGPGAMSMSHVFSMLFQVLNNCDDPRGPQGAALLAIHNLFMPEGYKIYIKDGASHVDLGKGFDTKLLDAFEASGGWAAIIKTLYISQGEAGTQIVGFQVLSLLSSSEHLMSLLPHEPTRLKLSKAMARGFKQTRYVEQAQVSLCQIVVALMRSPGCDSILDCLITENFLSPILIRSIYAHPKSVHAQHYLFEAFVARLSWVYGRQTTYEDPCPEEMLEYPDEDYAWTGRKPKHHTIRESMRLIVDIMRSPELQGDVDFMILTWKVIAVWVRYDKFQGICHEQELLVFGADRLDATLKSAEYTKSIFLAEWRLALTPFHMQEVGRHGALYTIVKVLEQVIEMPDTIVMVCGFLASILSMPDINVEGLHFRYVEALNAVINKHPNHFDLKCMVCGCMMQILERYKFVQFVNKMMTIEDTVKCLIKVGKNTDLSRIQRLHMNTIAFGTLAVLIRKSPANLKYCIGKDADCEPAIHIIQGLKDSIGHRTEYPDRIKFDELEEYGLLCLARLSESTEFSAHPDFNKYPTQLGFPLGKIHALVSDVQLAVCAAFYNSEAIRFEKSTLAGSTTESTATKLAEGIQGKGEMKGLEKRANTGLKGMKGLGGMKMSKWKTLQKVKIKKVTDTRLLRSKDEDDHLRVFTSEALASHRAAADLTVAVWGVWHRVTNAEDYRYVVFKEGTVRIAMSAMYDCDRWWYTHHVRSWLREEALMALRFMHRERDLLQMTEREKTQLCLAALDTLTPEFHADVSLVEVALGTIYELSKHPDLVPHIIDNGGIKTLADSFSVESADAHWNVVSTLLHLCDTVEQAGNVSCDEVMRVIVKYSNALSTCTVSLQDAMSDKRINPVVDRIKLLTKLCNLTARLMLNVDNKEKLCEDGIVDRLLYIMLQNMEKEELIEEASNVIRAAASSSAEVFSDDNQEDAVEALSKASKAYPTNTRLHVAALSSLRYIMPVADYRLFVVRYADIRSCLNTLIMEPGTTELQNAEYYELQMESLAVFQELVLAADARTALIKFGLKKILEQMASMKDDARIQLEGCIMLERLALYPEANGADWAADALEVLLQAMKLHVHHPLLREEAVTAVLYLTREEGNRAMMCRSHGERTLALLFAQITKDHPDRPRLCVNAWGLISEFSPQYFEALIVEQFSEGAPTAVRMLTDPPLELIGPLEAGIGELQAAACDCLRILLPLNECLEFAELDIVAGLVAAIRGLPSHEELQHKAINVLALATNNEINVKLILAEPTIGAICNSMNIWNKSIEVCSEGFTTLARIGTWECAHRQLSHEGALDDFKSLCITHADDVGVLAPAAALLENIVSDDIVRVEIINKGLVVLPLNSLERFPDSREIVVALGKLACYADLRAILSAAGAQERISRLVRPFVGMPIEHEYHDLIVKMQLDAPVNDSDSD